MEQISYVWAVIKVRCSVCRNANHLDVWPLVPMVYVGLIASMLIAWISLALQHACRKNGILFVLLLVILGPLLVFFLITLSVLYLVVLVIKLLYFILLGWRHTCSSCSARTKSIYGLGIAEFWMMIRTLMGTWRLPAT